MCFLRFFVFKQQASTLFITEIYYIKIVYRMFNNTVAHMPDIVINITSIFLYYFLINFKIV